MNLTKKDLNQYLAYLEASRIVYRAELVKSPGDENALHNLKLLESMTVEALARTDYLS
jgi:hypothetical protein